MCTVAGVLLEKECKVAVVCVRRFVCIGKKDDKKHKTFFYSENNVYLCKPKCAKVQTNVEIT